MTLTTRAGQAERDLPQGHQHAGAREIGEGLSDALKNLIGLERQAYDIDGPEGDNSVKQLSDLMDSLSQGA
jgi:hypothetical protein